MAPMTPQGAPKKTNTTAVVIILGVGVVATLCCVGGAAAIALPNFIHFNSRSKQSEVKSNLKGAWTAERAWFAERDTYTERFEEMGFISRARKPLPPRPLTRG